jgi:hypothetical protein
MYTKYTHTLYSQQSWFEQIGFTSPYKVAGNSKAVTLEQEGKTDNSLIAYPEAFTVRRVWLDQAAADEWKTYLTQLAIDYDVTIQITISDI